MRENRVPARTLLAYGGVALPLALAEVPILIYLPAFYAKELALDTGLVGLVFLLARLIDGLLDLLVGWYSDRVKSRIGRRKPLTLVAMPILLLGTWLLCKPPAGAGFAYLGGSALLFYVGLTLLRIPYWSWGIDLSPHYSERSRVTSFREFFTMLGNFSIFTVPMLFLPEDAPLGSVLNIIAIAILVLIPLCAIPLALLVPDPPPPADHVVPSWKSGAAAILHSPVALRFLLAIFLFWLSSGMINALAIFSFGVGLGLPNKIFLIILIYYVSTMAMVPLVIILSKRFDKHHLLAFGGAMLFIAFGGMVMVPAGRLDLVIAIWLVAGFGNAFVLALPMSLLADIVDYDVKSNDDRQPGTYVAAYNLVLKLGSAVGIGVAFGLLEFVQFVPQETNHSANDILNIKLVGFALPAILLIPYLLLILAHPIKRPSLLTTAVNSQT